MSWKILALSIGWHLGHWLVWAKCAQDAWSSGERDPPVQSGDPVSPCSPHFLHSVGLVACVHRSESEPGDHEHCISSFKVLISSLVWCVINDWIQPGWCCDMEGTQEECNDQAVFDGCCMGGARRLDHWHTTGNQVLYNNNKMFITCSILAMSTSQSWKHWGVFRWKGLSWWPHRRWVQFSILGHSNLSGGCSRRC